MTGVTVAPVVPPSTPAAAVGGPPSAAVLSRRPLPVPRLASVRGRARVYGLAAVDHRGRVADCAVLRTLAWRPGTRLDIREGGGLLVVSSDQRGVFAVTRQGHLRLPAAVRHWCRLVPGDRVLLAADPSCGLLVVHPPAALDDMVSRFDAAVLSGGEPA